jgi:1-deoxy-D-xylulose 5-phosphate reductoisomerase
VIDFLSGAVTLTYVIAAAYFVHFWRRTGDRLFFCFACAFAIFAVYQWMLFVLGAADERGDYAYLLRVIGFVLILAAIIDKNLSAKRSRR